MKGNDIQVGDSVRIVDFFDNKKVSNGTYEVESTEMNFDRMPIARLYGLVGAYPLMALVKVSSKEGKDKKISEYTLQKILKTIC